MGVEVILIPNIHMETPNYSITRIKHDDVNEETAQASYKMVELPAETAYVRSLSEEAKPSAPEALVKGITPATSAPIVEERVAAEKPAAPAAKTSFLSRIKKWLGGTGEVKVEEKAEDKTAREARDSSRNRSNRDRNRNRSNRDRVNISTGERGDRPQQGQRPQQANQPQSGNQARPERTPRPERSIENLSLIHI